MLMVLVLAAGMVRGAPPLVLAGLGLATLHPWWALGLMAVWAAARRVRVPGGGSEAVFLQAVAAELRAGLGLRAALVAASARVPDLRLESAVRLAGAGRPLSEVGGVLAGLLPSHGRLAAAAMRAAGSTGGRVAEIFDGLAVMALDEAELARERRTATAQARVSAMVVGGLPVLVLLYAAASDRLGLLAEAGQAGAILFTVGGMLLASGMGWVWLLLRRAG